MKRKNPALCIFGLLMLTAGILLCMKTHSGSYSESVSIGTTLSQVKADITETEKALTLAETPAEQQTLEASLSSLKEQKEELSAQKLSLEKPYSYSLILLFAGVLFSIAGVVRLLKKDHTRPAADITRLAQAGLLAALCYVGFAFFKIDIPVGVEKTAFHLGNVFCVLAALLLGGFWGGLAGATGMTIADLTTTYVTSAPKTFFLKFAIGLIVGLVAHKIFKLGKCTNKKHIAGITLFASICGMGFNVIADPITGYFYKTYLLGIPQDLSSALAKMSAVTSFVNAVVAVICATCFYLALRPALKKAGFLKTE